MNDPNETERLKRLNRDLISLLALPAMWPVSAPRGPTAVVELLLDVLLSMLRLDYVFARLMDPPFEAARRDGISDPPTAVAMTRAELERWLEMEPSSRSASVGDLQVASFNLGHGGGVLVAASRRAGFPNEDERLLLRVAANQIITGLEASRYLALERRRAEQLQKLARLSVEISSTSALDEMLHVIKDGACDIIGAQRATISVTDDERPIPSALTADLIDRSGKRIGSIHLWDKIEGEFTKEDEAVLVQLAHQASGAIVNARLYEQLLESHRAMHDAHRRKDEFLALLGHELRNPLAPILTALQLMELRGVTRSSEREIIERQVRHLVRLVDDLLDVSRITRGKIALKRETIEMADVIARAVEMASPLLEQRSHQLSMKIPRKGLRVLADPDRLAQVFGNLLTNAAKYTETGGRIVVAAERLGEEISVSVKDNGMGIAPDLLPKIFELFVQSERTIDRSQGGLGLGLALTDSLIRLHGGTVRAHSAGVGRGSEFVVKIPVLDSEEALPTTENERSPAQDGSTKTRVLIVDDNEDAAVLLGGVLQEMGYQVVVAHDGPDGLRRALEFSPEIAFLDIGLPVMDGYELARRLRHELSSPTLRLVAVSGYGQEHDRKRALECGFDAYLVKPVGMDAITAQILEHRTQCTGA